VGVLKNGAGTHHIGAIYVGDTVHSGITTSGFNLLVTPATATISTAVFNSQTGFPVNSTILNFNGGLGVTGTVTYTLYPNIGCTPGTGTIISTYPVAGADQVPDSAKVAPSPAGLYSFNAFYHNDTADNLPSAIGVTSPCEPFLVTRAPAFTAGKLHWTHHLSLSKSANTQSWTAIVTNPLSTTAKLVVRIVGISTINPSLTFDITCGVTCVTTATGGVSLTPGLTPVSVAAGTSSTSFTFNQLISGSFVNQKFAFTATVYWTTGTLYTASDSKSGSFAVVP
jgi:hypothetical protein